jgi:hypothetical protein
MEKIIRESKIPFEGIWGKGPVGRTCDNVKTDHR